MSFPFEVRTFMEVFITLFVIMDPVGSMPVFLGLTGSMTPPQRNKAARTAVFVSLGVIVLFAIFGAKILTYMHISIEALQASGGVLLFLVAMDLLTGKHDVKPPEIAQGSRVNVALVPLGTPLLAGPGAIVATMLFVSSSSGGASSLVSIACGIIAIHLCLFLAMRFAGLLQGILRDSGVTLVTRIAGLLLAAIAVQMLADAIIAFAKNAS